jgi:hypothetical protein
MRSRLATTLFLAACVLVAVPTAARAQSLLFDYVGFDYENPKAPGSQFGDVGNGYVGLGTVPFLFAPLVSNTALNEYTFVIDGLVSTGFVTVGPFRVVNYTPGTLTIYEDAKSGGTSRTSACLEPDAHPRSPWRRSSWPARTGCVGSITAPVSGRLHRHRRYAGRQLPARQRVTDFLGLGRQCSTSRLGFTRSTASAFLNERGRGRTLGTAQGRLPLIGA